MRTSGAIGSWASSARCLESAAGVLEGGEVAVAGLLDHLAALLLDELAELPVVPGEQLAPLVLAEHLDELGRVDDVGEHERPLRRVAQELGRPLKVEHGAQPLERRLRRSELLAGSVLVSGA